MKHLQRVYDFATVAAALGAGLIAFDAAAQAKSAPLPAPGSTRAATGPGTQTEDELYIGNKRSAASPANASGPAVLPAAPLPGAGNAPAKPARGGATALPAPGAPAAKPPRPGSTVAGGDEDLDELEIRRRTVDGDGRPSLSGATPAPRPGAGTSPNTQRPVEGNGRPSVSGVVPAPRLGPTGSPNVAREGGLGPTGQGATGDAARPPIRR